ncbi:DUF1761 domain-containing protein [Devosia algicola]|uniref:DUF1761 domain-containing protein n=1 Tax=Devosia algicola TaxID=3026418 RepID=A0ABY7YKP3_9HYPH|nr:DUF1761 domain-containing protein [Devosia algicola]WDR01738.1 DUF1761 domain-containing protein [Devosia algicola]
MNWLAIILAVVASMALGMGWYMALSRQWLEALGKKPEDINSADPSPYVWSVAVQLVMAYFLAVLIPALTGAINPTNGALVGAQLWVGFVVTAMILNHRYQGANWSLTFIDAGYLLGVLVVQGVVIGLFG